MLCSSAAVDAFIAFLLSPQETYSDRAPCTRCGTSDSKTWRPGPCGAATLCNKCGLRYMNGGRRTRSVDLVMEGERGVWVQRDTKSWKWVITGEANMKDERLQDWISREKMRSAIATDVANTYMENANKRLRLS